MKSLTLLIMTFFISICFLYSQPVMYEKGKIITKNNDTLNVFVELAWTYFNKVTYKTNINSDIKEIKITEIKQLFTPYNKYENVLLKKKEKLFRVLVKDEVSLLQYFERNPKQPIDKDGGTFTMDAAPTIIYAVKIKNEVYIIKNKKDKIILLPLCNNCPEVRENVQRKSFELDELEATIKGINKCGVK